MTSTSNDLPSRRRRVLIGVLSALAGIGGALYAYTFGARLSGIWLGIVTGALGGLFSTLVADALFSRWLSPSQSPDGRN